MIDKKMTTFSTFVNKKKLSFFKNDHFFDIHFFDFKNREKRKRNKIKLMHLFKCVLKSKQNNTLMSDLLKQKMVHYSNHFKQNISHISLYKKMYHCY